MARERRETEPTVCRMDRLPFGASCSPFVAIYGVRRESSPLIVKAKIRLRALSLKGLGWTEGVTGEDAAWWLEWFKAVGRLNALEMPRCLFPQANLILSSELHVFCDASEEAYAAVIYVRNQHKDGRVLIRQVRASTKLAPKKTLSVPKLELNAALLGARLLKNVQEVLGKRVDRRRLWTDSSTVRSWIRATAVSELQPGVRE